MSKSAVQQLIENLSTRTGARWVHTGGGCMAIEVLTAPGPLTYQILITDRDDVFGEGDRMNDLTVAGFNAVLRVYDLEQELYPDETAVTVYRTADDAGTSRFDAYEDSEVTDLATEVQRCADAVHGTVELIMRAVRYGRSPEADNGL